MVELEETFITQLQRVADTYKREMQEQQGSTAELETRLRAAQLAAHQAEAQRADAQKALQVLQVSILIWCVSLISFASYIPRSCLVG